MDFKIILLAFIASAGWLYLIANHFRYARQAARLDYDALASYRMNQQPHTTIDFYPND